MDTYEGIPFWYAECNRLLTFVKKFRGVRSGIKGRVGAFLRQLRPGSRSIVERFPYQKAVRIAVQRDISSAEGYSSSGGGAFTAREN